MMNEREELQVQGYYVVVITKLRVQYCYALVSVCICFATIVVCLLAQRLVFLVAGEFVVGA